MKSSIESDVALTFIFIHMVEGEVLQHGEISFRAHGKFKSGTYKRTLQIRGTQD